MILVLLVFIGEGICSKDRISKQVFSLKKEIMETDFSIIDKFQKTMENKEALAHEEGGEDNRPKKDSLEKKSTQNLIPFLAVVKKNTVVIDVKTNEMSVLHRSLNILAVEERAGSTYSYILNKEGEKKFLVKTSKIFSLKDDLDFSLGKNPAITYLRPVNFQIIDHSFPIESIATIYSDILSGSYFENLYQQRMERNFNLSRKEIKIFFPWIFPIRLGFAFSYQNDYWQTDEGSIYWKSFFAGPTLYFTLARYSNFDLNLHLGFLKSFLMESEFQGEYYRLSSNAFQLELAVRFFLRKGFLVAGSSLRHQRPSIKEGNANFALNPYRDSLNSIGMFVGYGFDFKL